MQIHSNQENQRKSRSIANVQSNPIKDQNSNGLTDNRQSVRLINQLKEYQSKKANVAQLEKLGNTTPPDGPDPEAAMIEWFRGLSYIADDKNNWVRVSREMVDNQRGERGDNHLVANNHLRMGARKAINKGVTKLFKVVGQNTFLKVVVRNSVIITAYYMSDGEAKRDEMPRGSSDIMWGIRKEQMATVG